MFFLALTPDIGDKSLYGLHLSMWQPIKTVYQSGGKFALYYHFYRNYLKNKKNTGYRQITVIYSAGLPLRDPEEI